MVKMEKMDIATLTTWKPEDLRNDFIENGIVKHANLNFVRSVLKHKLKEQINEGKGNIKDKNHSWFVGTSERTEVGYVEVEFKVIAYDEDVAVIEYIGRV